MLNSPYVRITGLRKSSRSVVDGKECVAVGTLHNGAMMAIVDTKEDGVVPDDQRDVLTFSPHAFAAMISSVV